MSTNATDRRLVTLLLVVLGALVLLPLFGMGFGMMGYGPMYGGMGGAGMWGGGMWGGSAAPGWMLVVGLVMPLLFLVALVVLGYLGYRLLTGSGGTDERAGDLQDLERVAVEGPEPLAEHVLDRPGQR